MKRRAPNIQPADLTAIRGIIDGWDELPLSWSALISRIETVLHVTYVRQTLHRYPEIAQALQRKKAELASRGPRRVGTGDLRVAIERIERLEAENDSLRALNDALLERFVRWAYNASLFGLDEQKLDQPLPPASRT